MTEQEKLLQARGLLVLAIYMSLTGVYSNYKDNKQNIEKFLEQKTTTLEDFELAGGAIFLVHQILFTTVAYKVYINYKKYINLLQDLNCWESIFVLCSRGNHTKSYDIRYDIHSVANITNFIKRCQRTLVAYNVLFILPMSAFSSYISQKQNIEKFLEHKTTTLENASLVLGLFLPTMVFFYLSFILYKYPEAWSQKYLSKALGKLRANYYAGAMTVMRSLQPIASGTISHLPSDLPPQILEYTYGKETTKHLLSFMEYRNHETSAVESSLSAEEKLGHT